MYLVLSIMRMDVVVLIIDQCGGKGEREREGAGWLHTYSALPGKNVDSFLAY